MSTSASFAELRLEGDLSAEEAAHLAAQGPHMPLPPAGHLCLRLADLDTEDGVAVAELINLVRALAARVERLTLDSAPQMLAHTLYKVGMLEDGRIRLVAPRTEEGLGAG